METKEVALLRAQVAVMNLFRAHGQHQPQGSVDMSRMVRLWPEYGLRTCDLRGAVARLSMRGLLRIVALDVGERIVMTEAGERWSKSLPSWLEYRLLVPRRSRQQFSIATGLQALPRPTTERRAARVAAKSFVLPIRPAAAA